MINENIIVVKSPTEMKSTRIDYSADFFICKENASYVIIAPGLNISGYGDTLEEANEMIRITFEDYCETLSNLTQEELIEEMSKWGFSLTESDKPNKLNFIKLASDIDIKDLNYIGRTINYMYHITTDSLMYANN